MRFEDGFEPAWGLVLREPISAAETRELLDRLAVSESGGEEQGTVGAVCEVSGVGPEVVGRMLADIRGVSWQEVFGNRLTLVEDELAQVSQTLKTHRTRIEEISSEKSEKTRYESEIEEELRAMAEERLSQKALSPIIYLALLSLGILTVLMYLSSQTPVNQNLYPSQNNRNLIPNSGYKPPVVVPSPPKPIEETFRKDLAIDLGDGRQMSLYKGEIVVRESFGAFRKPTPDESQLSWRLFPRSKSVESSGQRIKKSLDVWLNR